MTPRLRGVWRTAHVRRIQRKLTRSDVRDLRAWFAEWRGEPSHFCRKASRQYTRAGFPISPEAIDDVIARRSWAWVP